MAQSGQRLVRCTCLLLTQSGHATGLIQINANLVRMWLSWRSLRGLKFDTAAVPLAGGRHSQLDKVSGFSSGECNANLHLAWSVHFRFRQGHGG